MADPERLKTDGIEYRSCKACKAPLAIVMGPNGKRIPLDLRAPVYSISEDMTGAAVAMPHQSAHVSHFSSCPRANEFSGAKARKR